MSPFYRDRIGAHACEGELCHDLWEGIFPQLEAVTVMTGPSTADEQEMTGQLKHHCLVVKKDTAGTDKLTLSEADCSSTSNVAICQMNKGVEPGE